MYLKNSVGAYFSFFLFEIPVEMNKISGPPGTCTTIFYSYDSVKRMGDGKEAQLSKFKSSHVPLQSALTSPL